MKEPTNVIFITEETADICKELVLAEISKCKKLNIYTDDFLVSLENAMEEHSRERKVDYFRKMLERMRDVYGN